MKRNRHSIFASMLATIAVGILTIPTAAAINVGSGPWVWQNPVPQGDTLNAVSCFTTNN